VERLQVLRARAEKLVNRERTSKEIIYRAELRKNVPGQ